MPVALCFLAAFSAMLWHAWQKSPTYDEFTHIQAGFYHWRHHDMERGLEHPPLFRLWAAIPLTFLDLTDPQDEHPIFLERPLSVRKEQLYGTILVYNSPEADAYRILRLSRAMMVLAALLLLALIYQFSRELYGERAALLSLFLAGTFPPLLGHGTLVATDVGGAAGALFFLYSLFKYFESPSLLRLLYCGFTLGLAQASKLSNVILIPASFFLCVIYPGFEGQGPLKRLGNFLLMLAAAVLVLNAFYRFQNVLPPHGIHPTDLAAFGWSRPVQWLYRWAPLPDFYLLSMGFMTYQVKTGFVTYLFGSVHPQGVWYYFPAMFLIRTPTAALAAIFAGAYSFRKIKLERKEWVLIVPLAIYLATTTFSKLNLGVRHLLFIYPLLFILAGRAVPLLLMMRRPVLIAFVILQLMEFARVSPHYLAFYNTLAGGPRRGISLSSDLDWGQDLSSLGKFMKDYPGSELILSYFGTGLPQYYGLNPQELLPSGSLIRTDKVNSPNPSKEFLAVSVSQIQGLMTGDKTLSWLKERKPVKVLGYSIYVYDVTSDRDAHLRLAEIYEANRDEKKAQRERERAKRIR